MATSDVTALLAAPYTGASPFSEGIESTDYGTTHGQYGEPFRYWDAVTLPDATADSNADGRLYIEATLGGNGMAYFSSAEDKAVQKEVGVIPEGSVQMSVLPTVAEIRKDSFILRTAPKQAYPFICVVARGPGDTDDLNYRFIADITRVTLPDGTDVGASHYQAVSADSPDDDDKGGLKWLSSAPASGTYYTVSGHYYQLYSCLWESYRGSPIGADGLRLPQRVLLKKERE